MAKHAATQNSSTDNVGAHATTKPSGSVTTQENTTTTNSSKDNVAAHAITNPSGSANTQKNTSLGPTDIHTSPKDSSTAARVFGINELVTLVLERVPLESRSPMRRVSRTWRSIISDIGHVVEPVVVNSFHKLLGCVLQEGPRYEVDFIIRMNSAINITTIKHLRSQSRVVVLEDVCDRPKLFAKRQEFITSPPITFIMLGRRHSNDDVLGIFDGHDSLAILRNRTGICIGDFLDTLDKLSAHAPPLVSNEDTNGSEDSCEQPLAFFSVRGHKAEIFLEEGYSSVLPSARDPNDSYGLE